MDGTRGLISSKFLYVFFSFFLFWLGVEGGVVVVSFLAIAEYGDNTLDLHVGDGTY